MKTICIFVAIFNLIINIKSLQVWQVPMKLAVIYESHKCYINSKYAFANSILKNQMIQTNKFRVFWLTMMLAVFFCLNSVSQTISVSAGPAFPVGKKNLLEAEKRALLVELTGNAETDEDLMKIVDKFWKFNKEYHFVSHDDLIGILKDKSAKYTILSLNLIHVTGSTNEFFRFSVYLSEKYSKRKTLFFQDILGFYKEKEFLVKKNDMIFALSFIQNHFKIRKEGNLKMYFFENEKYKGMLHNKTLLLDSALFDKKLVKAQIPKNYTLSYKVTSEKEIEEALMNRDSKFACVEILPTADIYDLRLHYIIDCENCNILSFGDYFNGAGDFKFSNYITEKHLRLYEKNGEPKVKK